MSSIPKPTARRRSKHSRSNEEKGGVSLETGVSNYGKTEACPARLESSLATPRGEVRHLAEQAAHRRAHVSPVCTPLPLPASTQICSNQALRWAKLELCQDRQRRNSVWCWCSYRLVMKWRACLKNGSSTRPCFGWEHLF